MGRLDATAKISGRTSPSRLPPVVGNTAMVPSDVRQAEPGDLIAGAQRAVGQLVTASSVDELMGLSAEAAAQIGFTRVLFSGVDRGIWLTQSAHTVDDPHFAEQLVAFGIAHARPMSGHTPEAEMLLSGEPILVSDAQSHPQVFRKLVKFARTTDYVAAPVQVWGLPFAMVHADRYPDRSVDEVDRQLLGLYADGLGLAIERAQLADRLKVISRASAFPGDRTDEGCERLPFGPPVYLAAAAPLLGAQQGTKRLSPREWDVLRSIALGKTNAQIATGLFLTENTVKVHVKRILRKLDAANRTEAAARYHRLTRRNL